MAEVIFNCPVCGCFMHKPKPINTTLKNKCRVRRFSCSNEHCDYTEVVLAGGNYIANNQEQIKKIKEKNKFEVNIDRRRRRLEE